VEESAGVEKDTARPHRKGAPAYER